MPQGIGYSDPLQREDVPRQGEQVDQSIGQMMDINPQVLEALVGQLGVSSISKPDPERKSKMRTFSNIIGDTLFSLGEGMTAAANAPRGRAGAAGFGAAITAPTRRRQQEQELEYERARTARQDALVADSLSDIIRRNVGTQGELGSMGVQTPDGQTVNVPRGDAAGVINAGIGANSRENVARITGDIRLQVSDDATRARIEAAQIAADNRMDVAELTAENRLAVEELRGKYGLERARIMADVQMRNALAGFTGQYSPVIDTFVEQLNTRQIGLSDIPSAFKAPVMMAMGARGLAIIPDEMSDKLTGFSAATSVIDSVGIALERFEEAQNSGDVLGSMTAMYRLMTEASAGARKLGRAMGEVGVFTDQDKADYAALLGPGSTMGALITIADPGTAKEWLEGTVDILNRVQEREFGDFFQRYDTGIIGRPNIQSTPNPNLQQQNQRPEPQIVPDLIYRQDGTIARPGAQ